MTYILWRNLLSYINRKNDFRRKVGELILSIGYQGSIEFFGAYMAIQ